MSAKSANQIIMCLIGIIIILISYIVLLHKYKNIEKEDNNNFNNQNEDYNNNYLNSLLKIQTQKVNTNIFYLKELSNLYEKLLFENFSIEIKDSLNLDLGRINTSIDKIYANKFLNLKDIQDKEFDSFQSRLIIAKFYNTKSLNNYLNIKNRKILEENKTAFANLPGI